MEATSEEEESVKSPPPLDQNIIEEVNLCSDHSNLLDFVREEIPTFCAEGQKFHGAKCMKCNKEFGESLKPSSKKPLYYCPHFEDHCDAVICFGCYSVAICEDTDMQKTRRSRRH